MQVFVKSFNGRTFTLDVEPSDTIYQVKQKIGMREQVPASQQRLLFSGCQLKNHQTISNSIITWTETQPTLHALLRLKGGGSATIYFNSLTDPITCKFAEQGPQWLTIDHGLNLEGVCSNFKCEAYNQWVCIPIGFGLFNMMMVAHKAKCPMCGGLCKNVEDMILYQARCQSVGMVEGEVQERKVMLLQDNPDEFLTFEEREESKLNWLYLEMEVTQL